MNTPMIDLYRGDCLATLRNIPDNSVDSIVTDPPYGLSNTDPAKVQKALTAWVMGARDYVPEGKGFMGQKWDEFVPPPAVWDECFRVLKPGGHMAVFAGSRTQDLMGLSIRLAGFDLRDSVAWLYGSGFPKSLNVSKAIATGGGRPEDIRRASMGENYTPSGRGRVNYDNGGGSKMNGSTAEMALPPEAKKWEGWGTTLKPGHEPIILARKPFPGTVAANVQEHGTGALNIDATRIPGKWTTWTRKDGSIAEGGNMPFSSQGHSRNPENPAGRWPANVILDEDQAAALDEQSGHMKDGKAVQRNGGGQAIFGGIAGNTNGAGAHADAGYGGGGGASRFFYVAKAGKKERPSYVDEDGDTIAHPTVKPVALMRWLIRLITPPGGTILEPFAGTGTTGEAAALEGFACIMIERHEPYLPLIRARMDRVAKAEK